MTGPVAGVLRAGELGIEEGEKEVVAEGNETGRCTEDTFLCVLSSMTMRSRNDYPITQISIMLLIYICPHFIFSTHLTSVILPLCEGSRACALLPIWARAVPWLELRNFGLLASAFQNCATQDPGLKVTQFWEPSLRKRIQKYPTYIIKIDYHVYTFPGPHPRP